MRFNKLDLNLLVALDAMLTLRSITRAAEQLHISQSAMSNALARLREYFDDALLVQVGRRMELTPRAEVLKEAVRDVLMRVDTTISAQPRFDAAQADREFRITVSDYSLVTVMPHVLALAAAEAPQVRFLMLPQATSPQQALEHGEADLLVIPQTYCSPDHPSDVLFEEGFTCVLWRDSALAREPLTLARYASAGHVMMRPSVSDRLSLSSWFVQQFGLTRRVEIITHSFVSEPHLVIGTERIATMHRRLAHQACQHLPLTQVAPPFTLPTMAQAMQWHKYRTQDPGVAWLRDLMHRAVQRMDALGARPDQAAPAAA